MHLRNATALTFVLVILLAGTALGSPQANAQYAIERAQNAVREQINRERGNNVDVTFPDWQRTQTYFVSNSETGVRGEGVYAYRNDYRRTESFTYDVVVNINNGRITRMSYRSSGTGGPAGQYPNNDNRYPNDDRYDRYQNVPNWLVGTYTGKSPTTRRTSTLTISRSGNITVTSDRGGADYGNYVNGQINFRDNYNWVVERNGRDLRVRDLRTNRSEKFKRTSDWNDNDNYNNNGNYNDYTNTPRWAVGTFRGDTDSGESELSIGPDGTASIRSLRTNQLFTGRYENGVLSFEFGSFTVTRDGNGIRTIERGNRRNQTSYRRID